MRPATILPCLLLLLTQVCAINLLVSGPPSKRVVQHLELSTLDLKFQENFHILCLQGVANISAEVKKQFNSDDHKCSNFQDTTEKLQLFYQIQLKIFQDICSEMRFPITDTSMGMIKPTCELDYPPMAVVMQNLQWIWYLVNQLKNFSCASDDTGPIGQLAVLSLAYDTTYTMTFVLKVKDQMISIADDMSKLMAFETKNLQEIILKSDCIKGNVYTHFQSILCGRYNNEQLCRFYISSGKLQRATFFHAVEYFGYSLSEDFVVKIDQVWGTVKTSTLDYMEFEPFSPQCSLALTINKDYQIFRNCDFLYTKKDRARSILTNMGVLVFEPCFLVHDRNYYYSGSTNQNYSFNPPALISSNQPVVIDCNGKTSKYPATSTGPLVIRESNIDASTLWYMRAKFLKLNNILKFFQLYGALINTTLILLASLAFMSYRLYFFCKAKFSVNCCIQRRPNVQETDMKELERNQRLQRRLLSSN